MDTNQILEKLKNIIEPYVPEKNLMQNITGELDLINDLKINSAHVVDIILDIEETFDIMIDDDSINSMNTVGEAVGVITTKIAEK